MGYPAQVTVVDSKIITYHSLVGLAPNKGGWVVSNDVQYVSVAQSAAKLQLVKVEFIDLEDMLKV